MRDKYSMIVIGGGLAGLSTALTWKKLFPSEQKPVAVFEKNPIPGGCVSTFAREGYRFDTVQIIPDVKKLFEFFDIDIPLVQFDNLIARLFIADIFKSETFVIPIPAQQEYLEDILTDLFPEDAFTIQRFFDYCFAMCDELKYLKTEPAWYNLPGILLRCRKILANSDNSFHKFLDSFHFKNSQTKLALDAFSSFSGLSGNRCASLLTACAMVTTLKGSYRTTKGFIEFPLTLKNKLVELGGEFYPNSPVEKILTEQNKVKGVQLASGEVIYADYVVSTADTKLTFEKLLSHVANSKNEAYYQKVKRSKMSPSGFAIHLGLDDSVDLQKLGFDCGYNILTTDYYAHARAYEAWENGELLLSDTSFYIAVSSPSVMTGGKPCLVIHVIPVPSEYWIKLREKNIEKYNEEKLNVAKFFIRKVEKFMIPELEKHIRFIDVSTPATFERYIGSPTGSLYDMLPVPSNFGRYRLPVRTPIEGLFLPKFSHGIWPSMQAGLQVVDLISGGKVLKGNASLI